MNHSILDTQIQDFISENLKSDIANILLKGIPFDTVDSKLVIQQIEAKKRCQKKLPTWYNHKRIYYPNKLNIEQTSSEVTAKYKSDLVSGFTLADITGGFGVDVYFFSKKIENVFHCEINKDLSEIVNHNFQALKASNINCIQDDGINFLKQNNQQFDWIYVDPSRRDDTKRKVFLLTDCTPNVKTFQGLFLKYAKNVMIKTSPLLDINATRNDLQHTKELHIVAVNNEVKELIWIIERDYEGELIIKTLNIAKNERQEFQFFPKDERKIIPNYSEPFNFLYEPNSAILKAGAFQSIAKLNKISKLHKHSHLYTSNEIVDFPGRRFKIEHVLPFHKKSFSKLGIKNANVTTRNFPLTVHEIRKKLNIKDGGKVYLFFTTNLNNQKVILVCSKM